MSLKHYQQFKEILADYQMSDRAKQALHDLKLVLMVAPTSTGRNTIIRSLLASGKYYFIVSDTTRQPQLRDGKMERNGINYYFRSEEQILDDLKKGEFLEAAIIHEQQVSGISIRELEKAAKKQKIAITDIEIVGTDNVMKAKPDSIAIFLVPPSFEEWLTRLNQRGEMTAEEKKSRLSSAKREFKTALEGNYYQFVVAGDINRTSQIIDKLAHGGKDGPEQRRGRLLAEELLRQLMSN